MREPPCAYITTFGSDKTNRPGRRNGVSAPPGGSPLPVPIEPVVASFAAGVIVTVSDVTAGIIGRADDQLRDLCPPGFGTPEDTFLPGAVAAALRPLGALLRVPRHFRPAIVPAPPA